MLYAQDVSPDLRVLRPDPPARDLRPRAVPEELDRHPGHEEPDLIERILDLWRQP